MTGQDTRSDVGMWEAVSRDLVDDRYVPTPRAVEVLRAAVEELAPTLERLGKHKFAAFVNEAGAVELIIGSTELQRQWSLEIDADGTARTTYVDEHSRLGHYNGLPRLDGSVPEGAEATERRSHEGGRMMAREFPILFKAPLLAGLFCLLVLASAVCCRPSADLECEPVPAGDVPPARVVRFIQDETGGLCIDDGQCATHLMPDEVEMLREFLEESDEGGENG